MAETTELTEDQIEILKPFAAHGGYLMPSPELIPMCQQLAARKLLKMQQFLDGKAFAGTNVKLNVGYRITEKGSKAVKS